jgi:hypothetical protein
MTGARQMELAILFVVVVGAILVWWLRSARPKQGFHQTNDEPE